MSTDQLERYQIYIIVPPKEARHDSFFSKVRPWVLLSTRPGQMSGNGVYAAPLSSSPAQGDLQVSFKRLDGQESTVVLDAIRAIPLSWIKRASGPLPLSARRQVERRLPKVFEM